jgi:thiol-disulfide isomerase/thioredoxin
MLVLRATALAAALFVITACGADSPTATGGESTGTPPAATTPAPEPSGKASTPAAAVPEALKFTGTTLDGKAFDGATLASKPTVLWFWAPWCPKCRAQAEATAKVAGDYKGKVNVVGVAGLDKTDAMREFVTDQKVGGFPHLSDEAGAIWKRFEVTEQSTYVVLDAGGNKVFSGNLVAGDGLAEKVAKLVG